MIKNINGICLLTSKHNVSGIIYLDEIDNVTRIYGTIYGLKPNSNYVSNNLITFQKTPSNFGYKGHAIHIHEYGDLTDGCNKCCAHYNPFNMNHGGPLSQERHIGDLGNIIANENGIATFSINDNLVKLSGEYSIIGRSIVIHEDEDDLGLGNYSDSLVTGHAGKRIACGIIGYRSK